MWDQVLANVLVVIQTTFFINCWWKLTQCSWVGFGGERKWLRKEDSQSYVLEFFLGGKWREKKCLRKEDGSVFVASKFLSSFGRKRDHFSSLLSFVISSFLLMIELENTPLVFRSLKKFSFFSSCTVVAICCDWYLFIFGAAVCW